MAIWNESSKSKLHTLLQWKQNKTVCVYSNFSRIYWKYPQRNFSYLYRENYTTLTDKASATNVLGNGQSKIMIRVRFGREVEPNKLLSLGWPTFKVGSLGYQHCAKLEHYLAPKLHLMRCQQVNELRARQFLMIAPTENGVKPEYSSCPRWPTVLSQVWKARRRADKLSDQQWSASLQL